MQTTSFQVRQELRRGRDETILVTIFANFFLGGIALGVSYAIWQNVLPGFLLTLFMFGTPIWRNWKKRKLSAGAFGLNAAYRAIAQGKLGEAEELLLTVEQFNRDRWAKRLISIQRAHIALRRGDLKAAKLELDESLSLADDGSFKTNTGYQIEGAHAMRAFVNAGLGDREAALSDAAWVRSLPHASPEALARVTLAEAILLERAGEREALRALIDTERTLLLEHTHPRERAIVRAFQRMLKVSTSSVYRERAPEEVPHSVDEPDLDDWVARVAPGAAGFVRKQKRAQPQSPQEAQWEAQRKHFEMQQAHQMLDANVRQAQWRQPFVAMPGHVRNTKSNSQRNLFVALGTVGVLMLAIFVVPALWGLVSTTNVSAPAEDGTFAGTAVAGVLGALALGGATYAFIRRAHKRKLQQEQLAPAHRAAVQRTSASFAASSMPDLAALTEGPDDVLAAQGHMMIASGAEQRGEWSLVLQECDKGIARLWSVPNQHRADILYPDLHSLRAFALACMGRYADAEIALRFLGPSYPHFERATFRVRLVELLQSVGAQPAATFAELHALELPLSVREELLADLVRAVATPDSAGLGEVARLRDELEKTQHARAWVSSICPALLNAFVGQHETDLSDLSYQRAEEREAEAEMETDLTNHPARVMFNR